MSTSLQELATLDRVIHEPARLMIMTVLYAVSEADFIYLQNECGLTQGNLSSHLTKLEEANAQIRLYSPCVCGSGKKFKFCCHKKS